MGCRKESDRSSCCKSGCVYHLTVDLLAHVPFWASMCIKSVDAFVGFSVRAVLTWFMSDSVIVLKEG
jgi:hypothetical protein